MTETITGQREPIKLSGKTLNQLFGKLKTRGGLFVSFKTDGVNMTDRLVEDVNSVRFWHKGHWDHLENSEANNGVSLVRTCEKMRHAGELVYIC